FHAEDGIRDFHVTGVQTCALPISLAGMLALAGCGASDPLANEPSTGASGDAGKTVVVGSQAYYSNEIIAEIYAQALEKAGFTVRSEERRGGKESTRAWAREQGKG